MTILAFWSVDSEIERHEFDYGNDEEAFLRLWENQGEWDARFYNMDTDSYSDLFGHYGILNASDFEEDYNNEEYDGGWWTKVLHLSEEYVKQVIE